LQKFNIYLNFLSWFPFEKRFIMQWKLMQSDEI
jgi:hypothetical protein